MWAYILVLLLLFVVYWYIKTPKNLPPGPFRWPIVGYLPFLGEYPHLTFEKLSKIYGNIFHLYFGSRLVIVLNDYSAIHEAFVKNADVFAGRLPNTSFINKIGENFGIIANDGEFWKQHRRFILTNLRDYGVGKLELEPLLLNEINHFLEVIKKKNGQSFAVQQLLHSSLANNINILVTGRRYEYDDPTLLKLMQLFRQRDKNLSASAIFSTYPWISKIPGIDKLLKRDCIKDINGNLLNICKEIVQKVKLDYKDGQRDNYVCAFLTERSARIRANGYDDIFNDKALVHITRDLLVAGTETTATTLNCGLLYMTLNPEIQNKVQLEIDRVIGREREPSYNDRIHLPYTEATIMEIHRILSLVPLSVSHRTTRDVVIQNHRIPKDTMILPNLHAVHHDAKIWGDPENFRPERFIGPNGQIIKSDYLIQFSIGKRACAGEPLARMEMFLYFVSFLQHFTFVPPEGEMPTLEYCLGVVKRLKFQFVCAKSRT